MSSFARTLLDEAAVLIQRLDVAAVEDIATGLADVRAGGGRLFILGVGGSAGHASHAVNDFRKICHFEAYTPTDNVSELTALVNDDARDTSFSEWLKASRLASNGASLVFSSVGAHPANQVPNSP